MSSGHKQTQQSLVHIYGSISSLGTDKVVDTLPPQRWYGDAELAFFLESCHAMFLGKIIFLPSF